MNLGKAEKAISYLRQALGIQKEILGEKHPFTATSYYNLGVYFADLGRYEEALSYDQRALEIQQEILGEHPYTAHSHHNVGVRLVKLERYEEALSQFQQAPNYPKKDFRRKPFRYSKQLSIHNDVFDQFRQIRRSSGHFQL